MQTANHTDASEPKVVAIDTDQVRRMSVNHDHLEHLARDAANATHAERQMTLWQGRYHHTMKHFTIV